MNAEGRGHDIEGIAQLHQEWMDAVTAGDAEALRDIVTDDYEVWAHATAPLRGPDAVVAAMRGALERYRVSPRFEPVETVVAGEWAFQRGIERMTVAPRDGGDSRTMEQRALVIMRRGDDGRWRYARGMTNGLPVAT